MLREVFTLCILGLNFAIGTFICGVLIRVLVTPLLRRHFRHIDEHPHWYELPERREP